MERGEEEGKERVGLAPKPKNQTSPMIMKSNISAHCMTHVVHSKTTWTSRG